MHRPGDRLARPCARSAVAALADLPGAVREREERERAIAKEGYRQGHYGLVGLDVLPDRVAGGSSRACGADVRAKRDDAARAHDRVRTDTSSSEWVGSTTSPTFADAYEHRPRR